MEDNLERICKKNLTKSHQAYLNAGNVQKNWRGGMTKAEKKKKKNTSGHCRSHYAERGWREKESGKQHGRAQRFSNANTGLVFHVT